MATVFTHPAIALSLTPWFREARASRTKLFVGIILTVLPDLDVIGFKLGIPYGHMFGHRGFSHSLFFAAVVSGFTAGLISRSQGGRVIPLWLFLFLCMASHGLLDALTNGGLGIAFLSPFSEERFFFNYRPIKVSMLSLSRFFNRQGITVLQNEIKWVLFPCMCLFFLGLIRLKAAAIRLEPDAAGTVGKD